MPSLVEQLQAEALDPLVPVSELLRKAKVVAVKLELNEFLEWIESELGGYKSNELPEYRQLKGEAKALNPLRGWQPLMMDSVKGQEWISQCPTNQAISEIEELLRDDKNDTFHMSFLPEIKEELMKGMDFPAEIQRAVDRSQLAGLLSAVRNMILDWSLKLEKAGIRGDGISFSQQDKEKAHEPQIVYQINKIESFTGILGGVSGQAKVSVKQINSANITELQDLVGQMKKHIRDVGLDSLEEQHLKETISALELELAEKYPGSSKIKGFLGSIKSIMESAAGNVIAKGILAGISKFIG